MQILVTWFHAVHLISQVTSFFCNCPHVGSAEKNRYVDEAFITGHKYASFEVSTVGRRAAFPSSSQLGLNGSPFSQIRWVLFTDHILSFSFLTFLKPYRASRARSINEGSYSSRDWRSSYSPCTGRFTTTELGDAPKQSRLGFLTNFGL